MPRRALHRLPGDILFIAGGVMPLLYLCWKGIRHAVPRVTLEEPEDILFTEITVPAGAEPETASPVSGERIDSS